MSLLSIVQNAAYETKGPLVASVAGNTDPSAQNYLRLLNSVGTRLMRGVAWQVLRKEQTFTAVSGSEQTSILPSDFDRFIPETFWDRTAQELLTGPITPVEWQGLQAVGYDADRKFAYRGDSVFVIPSYSSGGSTLAFEYVSNQWCQSAAAAGKTAFSVDTDTGVLDEELLTLGLIARYSVSEGLETAGVAVQTFMDYMKMLAKNDQPGADVLVAGDIFTAQSSRHFTGTPPVSGTFPYY
jgi:hypothetical protein